MIVQQRGRCRPLWQAVGCCTRLHPHSAWLLCLLKMNILLGNMMDAQPHMTRCSLTPLSLPLPARPPAGSAKWPAR